MSAINPASFVTPSAGLQPPGAGTLGGFGQEAAADRRHPHESRNYNMPHLSSTPPNVRDYLERGDFAGGNPSSILRNAYMDPYQALGSSVRQHEPGFAHATVSHDPFASFPSNGHGILEHSGPEFARAHHSQRTEPTEADWVGGLQGLSLNS